MVVSFPQLLVLRYVSAFLCMQLFFLAGMPACLPASRSRLCSLIGSDKIAGGWREVSRRSMDGQAYQANGSPWLVALGGCDERAGEEGARMVVGASRRQLLLPVSAADVCPRPRVRLQLVGT